MRRAAAGFTLVEVLLAIAIGAVILGGISSTLFSLISAEKQVEKVTERDRAARRLMFRVRREIQAALLAAPGGPISGADGGDQDSMEILTGAYGAPSRVEYFWQDGILWRRQSDPTRVTAEDPVPLRSVETFTLRYFSEDEWREDWDAAEPPRGVSVLLRIGGKDFGTVISL